MILNHERGGLPGDKLVEGGSQENRQDNADDLQDV
jgi:hypothetical protein